MRILSGIQPSGTLHLGNYFGAIQQHVELQQTAGGVDRAFYFIANYHSLTTLQDAPRLRALTLLTIAIDYLYSARPRSGEGDLLSPGATSPK